jgi:hypothetical protein
MLFSRKNAGKWIASKEGKLVHADKSLDRLMKKVVKRKDQKEIRFDLVPPQDFFVGMTHGV